MGCLSSYRVELLSAVFRDRAQDVWDWLKIAPGGSGCGRPLCGAGCVRHTSWQAPPPSGTGDSQVGATTGSPRSPPGLPGQRPPPEPGRRRGVGTASCRVRGTAGRQRDWPRPWSWPPLCRDIPISGTETGGDNRRLGQDVTSADRHDPPGPTAAGGGTTAPPGPASPSGDAKPPSWSS